jgi:hypothetical protein
MPGRGVILKIIAVIRELLAELLRTVVVGLGLADGREGDTAVDRQGAKVLFAGS